MHDYHSLNLFCQSLERETAIIPPKRKEELLLLSQYISSKIQKDEVAQLIVICTHNSRRSHFGQICLALAASYYQLPSIKTFSGGTEATAFNIRAVKALQKVGFQITVEEESKDNPNYQIRWAEGMTPYKAFSKKYADPPNPTEKFGAILVCTQADQGCPIVSGCDFRIALPFDDPKDFDDTALEEAKYHERLHQIGREMFFVLSQIEKNNPSQ